jgi:hypothetical protein
MSFAWSERSDRTSAGQRRTAQRGDVRFVRGVYKTPGPDTLGPATSEWTGQKILPTVTAGPSISSE